MSDMNNFQVGIIGGGPAGYTAAEAAAKPASALFYSKDNLEEYALTKDVSQPRHCSTLPK